MGKVHVITGGSSGIGLECAKLFKQGTVVIAGRGEEKLKNAAEELKNNGVDVKYQSTDVTDKVALKKLFDYASEFGELATVVHAAGVSGTIGDVMKTLQIDLVGTHNVIEESISHVKKGTSVILIASMMGHMVPPNEEHDHVLINPEDSELLNKVALFLEEDADKAYNYAKRGVQLLAKTNATRFGEKGGRILSVSPGIIMTDMAKKAAEEHPEQMKYMESITPVKRNGEPEDIAELVYFLANDNASFITGTDILIDGGLTLNLQKQEQKK